MGDYMPDAVVINRETWFALQEYYFGKLLDYHNDIDGYEIKCGEDKRLDEIVIRTGTEEIDLGTVDGCKKLVSSSFAHAPIRPVDLLRLYFEDSEAFKKMGMSKALSGRLVQAGDDDGLSEYRGSFSPAYRRWFGTIRVSPELFRAFFASKGIELNGKPQCASFDCHYTIANFSNMSTAAFRVFRGPEGDGLSVDHLFDRVEELIVQEIVEKVYGADEQGEAAQQQKPAQSSEKQTNEKKATRTANK